MGMITFQFILFWVLCGIGLFCLSVFLVYGTSLTAPSLYSSDESYNKAIILNIINGIVLVLLFVTLFIGLRSGDYGWTLPKNKNLYEIKISDYNKDIVKGIFGTSAKLVEDSNGQPRVVISDCYVNGWFWACYMGRQKSFIGSSYESYPVYWDTKDEYYIK